MKHCRREFYLEDRYGGVILTLKATTVTGAALMAARRGHHNIIIRDPVDETTEGFRVHFYHALRRYRGGKLAARPFKKVRKEAKAYRNRILQATQRERIEVTA